MLSLNSVTKRYGKKIVFSDIDLTISEGLTVLVGPSGAGKSTLLRLCATAEKPTSGTLQWRGQDYSKTLRKLRRELGYGPQIVDLPEDLTGLEFLQHMAALKMLGAGAKLQGREILGRLGLAADADRPIAAWSGGMRRRLIVAQAMLGTPQLLTLDEPTAELDVETAGKVNAMIKEAAQSSVVLMTTHLSDQLQNSGATVIRVADGAVSPA